MAFTLVAAACGSDDDNASTTVAPDVSVTDDSVVDDSVVDDSVVDDSVVDDSVVDDSVVEPATGDPVKIGLAIGLTGSKAESFEAVIEIAEAWVQMTNDTGGLAGHPVELFVEDTKSDAAQAQAAVAKLVEEDEVVALFLNDTSAEGAAAEYLKDQDIAVIGSEGYNTEVWGALPNFVEYWLDIPGTIYGSPYVAATLGSERFAAFSCAEVAACAQAEAIYEPAAEALGMEWSGLLTIAASAPDYTAECLTIIERDVDFVILSVVSSVAIRVVQDCLQQGYEGVFGSAAGGFEMFAFEDVPGATIAGPLHGFPWWVDADPVEEYRAFLAEYAPDTEYRSPVHSNMYAGLELLELALADQTGEVTRETVFEGYYGLDGETLGGLLAQPFGYGPDQPATKGICYWPFLLDTTTGEISLVEPSGESGNGNTDSLRSSCVTELAS